MSLPGSQQNATALNAYSTLTDIACRGLTRMMQAQAGLCEVIPSVEATTKKSGLSDRWERMFDQNLQVGREIYLASITTQTDLMHLSEKMLLETQRDWLRSVDALADRQCSLQPALAPLQQALTVGSCAFESMSKATRQVARFAGTNLSSAAVNVVLQARRSKA